MPENDDAPTTTDAESQDEEGELWLALYEDDEVECRTGHTHLKRELGDVYLHVSDALRAFMELSDEDRRRAVESLRADVDMRTQDRERGDVTDSLTCVADALDPEGGE